MNYSDNPRVAALIRKGMPSAQLKTTGKSAFGPKDIPALVRMATDVDLFFDEDDEASWAAPVHAWRELGLLRAPEGVAPLLQVLDLPWDEEEELDDWRNQIIPSALALIGEPALGPVGKYLVNRRKPMWGRMAAAIALQQMGTTYLQLRSPIITRLTEGLSTYAKNSRILNGALIMGLLELRGVESLETIRAAFAARSVDLSLTGDLEDAEITLGLRTERETSRRNYFLEENPDLAEIAEDKIQGEKKESINDSLDMVRRSEPKVGRNEPCPCGSGKKYKKCCLNKER